MKALLILEELEKDPEPDEEPEEEPDVNSHLSSCETTKIEIPSIWKSFITISFSI